MKTIPLTTALFWNPLFVPYPHNTINLASKLGLRTRSIANGVIKKRIESVWANRTFVNWINFFKIIQSDGPKQQ